MTGGISVERNFDRDTKDYAGALRAIGQDVADLLPLYLEIEVTNNQFLVRGRGLAERTQGMDKSIENFLRKVWNMMIRHDPAADILQWQLCSVPFARTYTQEDIRRRNENSSTRRKSVTDMPDVYSLGERLRIVGRMVDAKQSDLVRVSKSLSSVAFQYLDEHGQIHMEEYSASDLYRVQQEFYAKRDTSKPIDPTPARNLRKTIAA